MLSYTPQAYKTIKIVLLKFAIIGDKTGDTV